MKSRNMNYNRQLYKFPVQKSKTLNMRSPLVMIPGVSLFVFVMASMLMPMFIGGILGFTTFIIMYLVESKSESMSEFRVMILDAWNDNVFDKCMVVFFAVCATALYAGVMLVVVYVGDNIHAIVESGTGIIIDKIYTPESIVPVTTTTTIGKITTTTTTMVTQPPSWELKIKVDNLNEDNNIANLSVNPEYYYNIHTYTKVYVTFVHGNWTGSLYIRSAQVKE